MYEKLKAIAHASGATAFGVAQIEDLRSHFDARAGSALRYVL